MQGGRRVVEAGNGQAVRERDAGFPGSDLLERAEITDTLLHEIAHAIVGVRHQHDAVWRTKAREIGCTAERWHAVNHTPARWVGACGCGKRWLRQRLSRNLRLGARCGSCNGEISWRRNTDLGPSATS